jgi:hypothetical protein
MSDATRQPTAASLRALTRAGARVAALLGALELWAAGCARFGFERVEPGGFAGIGGALVITGAGGAGSASAGSPGAGGADAASGGSGSARAAGSAGVADSDASAPPDPGDCSDGVRDGDETGADCGGSRCSPCPCSLGAPELLGDPNSPGNDLWSPKLSSDGLELYFAVTVPGFGEQIGVATRPDRASPFGLGQALPAPVNTGGEGTPDLSLDGRSLYFYSSRSGGAGNRDLYVATRSKDSADFGNVTPLTSLNTPDLDYQPWLSADELSIYFASGPAGSNDIFRATRGSTRDDFGQPQLVSELSSPSDEGGLTVSSDGLEVILTSNRPGGPGGRDLYVATRASQSAPFSTPQLLDALDTAENEIDPAFSPDGSELYFVSNRGGGDSNIYRVARSCQR